MAADVTAADVLVVVVVIVVATMPFRRSTSFGRGQSRLKIILLAGLETNTPISG